MKLGPRITSLSAALVLVPTAALAHAGIGRAGGFMHGFTHPISGIDHVLAMILVGIFAYQLGGRALWLVPAAFVAAMALGGALGLGHIPVPLVEIGIALSVIVLGALVATSFRAPVLAASAIVGFFAVFHGFAHGAEMPANASAVAYAVAFLAATAVLHATGAASGFLLAKVGRRSGSIIMRTAGALGLVAGLGIVGGVL